MVKRKKHLMQPALSSAALLVAIALFDFRGLAFAFSPQDLSPSLSDSSQTSQHHPVISQPHQSEIATTNTRLQSSAQSDTPVPDNHPQDEASVTQSRFFSLSLEAVLMSFWKGLTTPFPSLRRIMLHPSMLERKKRAKSIGLTSQEGLVAFTIYLIVGVLVFHQLETNWSIVDALYFSSTCFTTVGLGDLSPSTPASKLFTTLFGLGGIAFLGSAIATVGHSVLEVERDAIHRAEKLSRQSFLSLFDDMHKKLSHFRTRLGKEEWHRQIHQARSDHERKVLRWIRESTSLGWIPESSREWWGLTRRIIRKSLPSLFIIISGGFVMRYLNGDASWSILESIYFAFITASTIGFGDLAPSTKAARAFGIFFLPIAVACAGEVFSSIALAWSDRRQQKVFEQELARGLSMKHLKAMDADRSGQVSREEYVCFMLLEMGRVDVDELLQLQKQFDALDVAKSGYLDQEDLKIMAQLAGKDVQE